MRIVAHAFTAALCLVLSACTSEPKTEPSEPTRPAEPAVAEADMGTALLLGETAELHRQGRYQEGLLRLEQALDENPERPRLHYNLGVFHASLRDYQAAASAFEEELARYPGHIDSHRALGAAYTRLGRLEDSLPHFESCLAGAPDDELCTFELGRNLATLGLHDQAAPYLAHAAGLRRDAEAWAELGVVRRRLNDLEGAADAFAKALADEPSHLKTLLGYGQALTALGRSEDAGLLLERHKHLAALADQLDAFERSREQKEPPPGAWLDVAHLHLDRGDRPAAAAAYEQAIERDPGNPVPSLELARLYLEDGRLAEAERCIDSARAADPANPAPGFYRGLLLLKRGDAEAAARALTGSLESGGWPAAAFVDLGDAYREAGDLERAASAYLEGMRLEPDNPGAHHGLALASYRHGERQSAQNAARRAVELAPEDPDTWTLAGILLFEAGNVGGADSAFRNALALERMTLLRAGGADELLEDFPGSGGALDLYRRLLTES
ncbi:MAG: tetratricopeptide repeat protein [bacterium]|nr:tetratricopeptide repeat protein [bacterium]